MLTIRDIVQKHPEGTIQLTGAIRSKRDTKNISFISLYDGSCIHLLQVVAKDNLENFQEITQLTSGATVTIKGTLVPSRGSMQSVELLAEHITILGTVDEQYPLQKQATSMEHLRSHAHLRSRTMTFGAIFRIRSQAAFAIHQYFNKNNFFYVHTPLLTASDCEGAGEMFTATTLATNEAHQDHSKDFFKTPTHLTVSGQLNGEMVALGLGKIYTFGPVFRAEHSHTTRHLAESWMIEPELINCSLEQLMDLEEDLIKYTTKFILDHCHDELKFLEEKYTPGLLETLRTTVQESFIRISYKEAIQLLLEAQKNGHLFNEEITKDTEIGTEHEKYFTDVHFKLPVIIHSYPWSMKAFYMKKAEDTSIVEATDVLLPGIGETIGGSVREHDYKKLLENIEEKELILEDYAWYVESRKYGTIPHAGFGLGFDRLVMFLAGMNNIRDVIPFPRTFENIKF